MQFRMARLLHYIGTHMQIKATDEPSVTMVYARSTYIGVSINIYDIY